MSSLRMGLVGASRISTRSMIGPAELAGVDLVAVAARDPRRAEEFAAQHGIPRAVAGYQALLDDPDIDAVYNSLPNGLHVPWNLRAIAAGKHVLSEKPFSGNAAEAQQVQLAGEAAGLVVADGFHYRFHPMALRALELVADGAIGEVRNVDIELTIPAPDEDDPRWSLALAGGAMMDLGVYALHACRILAPLLGGEPAVESCTADERDGHPGVDEYMSIRLAFPGGARAALMCQMRGTAPGFTFAETITGASGSILMPNYVLPHLDDRLILRTAAGETVERTGTRPSYAYQLEAFAGAVQHGAPLPTDAADAVATMELVDDCYRQAGLDPRVSVAGVA